MINRIPNIDKDMMREALLWLSFATLPLTLDELCETVVLNEDSDDLDEDDRLQDTNLILESCQGLVTMDENWVTLAHFSVKEYLTSPRRKDDNPFWYLEWQTAHSRIASKCLTYLNLPVFRAGACDDETLVERHEQWPLLDYAAMAWGEHVIVLGETIDQALKQKIQDFLATFKAPNGGQFAAWNKTKYPYLYYEGHMDTESIYYLCSLGLTPIVRTMLQVDKSIDVNMRGGRFGSPLVQVAAYRGHYETTKLLLEAGADPNLPNHIWETAIYWTQSQGDDNITELLLKYGAHCEDPFAFMTPYSLHLPKILIR